MSERKASVLLVDGKTGRQAAVADAHARCLEVGTVYVTSNHQIAQINCPSGVIQPLLYSNLDIKEIIDFAREKKPDLIEILQENSLALPLAYELKSNGHNVLGPRQSGSRLENDKFKGRFFMGKAGIKTPLFYPCYSEQDGLDNLKNFGDDDKVVLKARDLAHGAGVIIAHNKHEAMEKILQMKYFPDRVGANFLLEEFVGGSNAEEFSEFYINDTFIGSALDEKTVFRNGQGPNGGGSGCLYGGTFITPELRDRINSEIMEPTLRQAKIEGIDSSGIWYLGGMHDSVTEEIWLIEYNRRWGDPEAEVILPAIRSNYYQIALAAARGKKIPPINLDKKVRLSAALMCDGYTQDIGHVVGRKLEGLDKVIQRGEVKVFGAGMELDGNGDYRVTGGRVCHFVAEAETTEEARRKLYGNLPDVYVRGDKAGVNLVYFRDDIGMKEIQRNAS